MCGWQHGVEQRQAEQSMHLETEVVSPAEEDDVGECAADVTT